MFDNDWKNWLLILVALVGVTFEVIKHLPSHETVWDAENLPFSGEVKPYSVHETARHRTARPATKAARVAGAQQVLENELKKFVAANTPAQTEFDHAKTETKVDPKKAKKKNEDEWEEVIDPITGKKIRRKKKKEAKKEEKKDTVVNAPVIPPSSKEDIPAALDDAIAFGGGALPNNDLTPNPAAAFGSLEDWIKRLLTYPDLKETQLFIQQFQQNLVSADIFYKIATMMVEDSRPEMKQLGVLCAGTTPNVISFQLLAQVFKTERSGSALQQQVVGFLNKYTSIGNLGVLESVLRGGDTYSATLAAQRLDLLAQHTRAAQVRIASTGNAAAQSTAITSNVGHYQRFITILHGLVASRDAGLADQARRTLADLQSLMGLTPTATTAATTASTQVP